MSRQGDSRHTYGYFEVRLRRTNRNILCLVVVKREFCISEIVIEEEPVVYAHLQAACNRKYLKELAWQDVVLRLSKIRGASNFSQTFDYHLRQCSS